MLGAAKVENSWAKDQLAAVKAKLKAKEESMARAQDEENTTRNRINLSKEQAGKESDRRLKDVAMYQKQSPHPTQNFCVYSEFLSFFRFI